MGWLEDRLAFAALCILVGYLTPVLSTYSLAGKREAARVAKFEVRLTYALVMPVGQSLLYAVRGLGSARDDRVDVRQRLAFPCSRRRAAKRAVLLWALRKPSRFGSRYWRASASKIRRLECEVFDRLEAEIEQLWTDKCRSEIYRGLEADRAAPKAALARIDERLRVQGQLPPGVVEACLRQQEQARQRRAAKLDTAVGRRPIDQLAKELGVEFTHQRIDAEQLGLDLPRPYREESIVPPAKPYYVYRGTPRSGVFMFRRRIDAVTWLGGMSEFNQPQLRKVGDDPLVYRIRIGKEPWFMTSSASWLLSNGWNGTPLDPDTGLPTELADTGRRSTGAVNAERSP